MTGTREDGRLRAIEMERSCGQTRNVDRDRQSDRQAVRESECQSVGQAPTHEHTYSPLIDLLIKSITAVICPVVEPHRPTSIQFTPLYTRCYFHLSHYT